MRIRLNGWQRIGVILSALWIVFILSFAVYELRFGSRYLLFIGPVTFESFTIYQDKMEWSRILLGRVVATALLPIPFFWLVAYGFVYALRWVSKGFKNDRT